MRAYLRPSSRQLSVSHAAAVSLFAGYRCFFTREAWTPVTLKSPDAAVPPFPARLLWQYRSANPRHLTLCVRGPAPSRTALTGGSSFEELNDTEGRKQKNSNNDNDSERDSAAAAASGSKDAEADQPRSPQDFMYGRLFLRPYNVAQLLTVLQGWSDAPAVVERPRSSLQLSTVAAPGGTGAAVPSRVPTAVQLTAHLTRKVVQGENGDENGESAVPHTDVDPTSSEDYPGSEYVEGEKGTFTAVLRDEDLVLLTNHLESVLSDFYGFQYHTIRNATQRALERERSRETNGSRTQAVSRSPSAAPAASRTVRRFNEAAPRPRTSSERPRYNSQAYHARQGGAATSRVTPPQTKMAVDMDDLFNEAADSAETGEAVRNAARAAVSQGDTATKAAAAEEEEEYEEVVEEVEEAEEGDGHASAAAAAQTSAPPAASTTSPPAASPATPSAAATSYHTAHLRDRGHMTVESDSRYAEGRFVRDGSLAAAEVAEVRRIGDFDVVHRTQQAEGATDEDGARTTVRATQTTGAFRSTSGEVTGTFAYQRVATATASTSEATVAAAAAASSIPLQRASATSSKDDVAGGDGGEEGPAMEVKATSVKPAEAEEGEEEEMAAGVEEEEEAEEAGKKAPRKRASAAGAGKKKAAKKKKSKKAAKSRSSSKAASAAKSAADASAQSMAF